MTRIAASFAVKMFKAWITEKDANSVTSSLRKANLDKRLLWNVSKEIISEQHLKHLKYYAPLLTVFSTQGQSQLVLLLKIQEYCYDNIHFMKSFSKIVMLFYKADVLSEEAILKWYKDTHAAKGKSIFLEQMKKFVEWLQNAEEESESEGEEG
ncbi:basic leucine zipper and W2 domain-containing protein 2-like [Thunnus maccoyii]|uniref:basic leucine zipper and W2 domain-containing protein 2-like n=1 Tax=Thunnus maccoyii TaxID=8240 RepID=UPI001C4B4D1E|nr:basic leucine zipper and W2 domain-containing protein 2-like [Thunnus maccoyii]